MGCFRLKMPAIIPVTIKAPETPEEWEQYYDLRWRMLRQPWQQTPGSEKDELEDVSIHRMAVINKNKNQQIIAIGRIHFTPNNKAQIRYMAVDNDFRLKGIGKKILQSLEEIALQKKINIIELNARESAITFYQANQYKIIEPAHTLYNKIKHFKMEKTLSQN